MDELLAAIAAAPDDDAPRLVLADWLSQRGDAWGELIVVSCELEPYFREQRRWDARAAALAERRNAIERERFPAHGLRYNFERGFCTSVRIEGGDLAQVEGPAFSLVEEVRSWDATAAMFAALAAWPRLATVSKVELRSRDDGGAREVAMEVLARAHRATDLTIAVDGIAAGDVRTILEHHPGLRRLTLVSAELAGQLAGMPWPRLEVLGLGACRLRAADAETLLACEALHDLELLDLDFNRLDAEGAAAVARCPFTRLARLDILGNELGDAGIARLAASASLAGLTTLQVGGDEDELDEALPLLASSFPRLAKLQLRSMRPISNLRAIARPYRELQLQLAHFDVDDLAALLAAPELRSLHQLAIELRDLSFLGEPPPPGGEPLGAALASAQLPALANLILDHCRLDEAGARALARASHLPRDLYLDIYGGGDLGAGAAQLRARFPLFEVR